MTDWDEDIYQDPETEYQDFLRALKRKRGFGLYFVRCRRREGKDLITRLTKDLSPKQVKVIRLVEAIDNLYVRIAKLAEKKNNQIDILFIQGIEYSLYQYELKNFGQITEKEYHNYKNVPRILNHLNQQRERFRDDFPFSLVFILPSFALRYFLIRAGDFFDWRSTILELPKKPGDLAAEVSRLLFEADYKKYLEMTSEARVEKILDVQELLSVVDWKLGSKKKTNSGSILQKILVSAKQKIFNYILQKSANENKLDKIDTLTLTSLFFELGNLLAANKEYKNSIISYDRALQIKPNHYEAWYNRGSALDKLGKYHSAIISYEKALQVKPNYYEAWYKKGCTLDKLGEYYSAINSYEKALQIKPDDHEVWYRHVNAQVKLRRYHGAMTSYYNMLQIQPYYYEAWNNWGNNFVKLGKYHSAINSYEKALKLKLHNYEAWNNRGIALMNLGDYHRAIESYDKALQLKPDNHQAWYNKACCYALQGNLEIALENLQKAISIDATCQKMAAIDSDFDSIRHEERFQKLLNK